MSLSTDIREYALSIGYDRVGFTNAEKFSHLEKELRERAQMYDFVGLKMVQAADPRSIFPEAQSIIVAIYDYYKHSYPEELVGKVGRCYQSMGGVPPLPVVAAQKGLLKSFLEKLGMRVAEGTPDRPSGARSGLTTYGKNCFAFADGIGSFLFILTLAVDKEIEYEDSPELKTKCPDNCTFCLDSCPTRALYDPFRMNPKRCIAYNTYFVPGHHPMGQAIIPLELRNKMGTWIFGCDVCQQVCPRNHAKLKSQLPPNNFLEYIAADFKLERLLHMTDEQFDRIVHTLRLNYIHDKRYFRRNAAVALGNQKNTDAIPALVKALQDPDEIVRGHTAWALGRIGGKKAQQALESGLSGESSEYVIKEIKTALSNLQSG
jgi:epoxyqueuosine reductase